LLIATGLILWLGVVTVLEFFIPHELFESETDISEMSIELGTMSYYIKAGKTTIGLVGIALLITGISIFIQDKRKGTVSYFSVKNIPVDIKQQTIFAFIPGLDLYASYKVKKLTTYFLVMIGVGILTIMLTSYLPVFSYSYLIMEAILLPIAIYLIRTWSKKWNQQFSDNAIEEIK